MSCGVRVLLFEGMNLDVVWQKGVAFCGLDFRFVFWEVGLGFEACESPHVNTDLQSPYPSTR